MSLIKLNSESIAAKNVLFITLVKVKSENLALIVDSLRTFFVTLNGEKIALKKAQIFSSSVFSQNQLALLKSWPSASFFVGLRWNNLDGSALNKNITSLESVIKTGKKMKNSMVVSFVNPHEGTDHHVFLRHSHLESF